MVPYAMTDDALLYAPLYRLWRLTAGPALFQCVLLLIRTLHTMIRYAIHLYDVAQTAQWERKGETPVPRELRCLCLWRVFGGMPLRPYIA